jgi:hypothetical protein
MGAISRLDAVNHILINAGEALVSDLTSQSGTDTELAEHFLNEVNQDIQLRGLANNTLLIKVSPDTNGKIYLRSDTLTCDLVSNHLNDNSLVIRGVSRGNPVYLWNVTDATDVWDDGEYWLRYVLKVEWDDMDTSVQRFAMAKAARLYQITIQGDAATDAYLAERESEAELQAQRQDTRARRSSVFDNVTPRMRSVIARTYMYHDPRYDYRGRY